LAEKLGVELLADEVGKLLVKPLENHVRMGTLACMMNETFCPPRYLGRS
jgi:hypothetical protein